jgi:hypothetical protein
MKKLNKKKVNGVLTWLVEGVQVTPSEWLNVYAQNKGYKNIYQLMVDRKYGRYGKEMMACRLKDEFIDAPEGLLPIPSAPDYYANTEGQIWCYSNKRKRWIMLTAYVNPKNNDYCTVQPYIDGKRYIRYVHRLVAEAFYGPVKDGYEVHHKDHNVTNNNADNLEIMETSLHRSMKKVTKKIKENLDN